MVYIYGILSTISFCFCGADSNNMQTLIIVNIGALVSVLVFGFLFVKEIEKLEKLEKKDNKF